MSAAPVFRLAVVLFLECGHVEWVADSTPQTRVCDVHGPVNVTGYQIAEKTVFLR